MWGGPGKGGLTLKIKKMSYPLCMKLQSFFFVLFFVSCNYLEKWRNESIFNVTCINNKKRRKSHLNLSNFPCLLIETWRQSIIYWPIVIIHPCLITHPFSKAGDARLVILNPAHRAASRAGSRGQDNNRFATALHAWTSGVHRMTRVAQASHLRPLLLRFFLLSCNTCCFKWLD